MAERWQQWMPFHIDRFRGSPDVQAMSPAARWGYLSLLASAWQSEDCTVSADPMALAAASTLGEDEWAKYGPRILRKFVLADGRYRNEVLREEWAVARRVFESRSQSARRTNAVRAPGRAGERAAARAEERAGERTAEERAEERSPSRVEGWAEERAAERAISCSEQRSAEGARERSASRSPNGHREDIARSPSRRAATQTGTGTSTGTETQDDTRADEPTVEEIVCAHPAAVTRGLTPLQVAPTHSAAVVEVLAAGESRTELLAKTQAIAAVVLAEWPPGELRFLKRIDAFFRERDYNRPLEEWRYGKSHELGWHGKSQDPGSRKSQHPGGARQPAAVERQLVAHDAIRAAGARRYGMGVAAPDGGDAGAVSEPDAARGHAGHVPRGVGRDGAAARAGGVSGCTLEGHP